MKRIFTAVSLSVLVHFMALLLLLHTRVISVMPVKKPMSLIMIPPSAPESPLKQTLHAAAPPESGEKKVAPRSSGEPAAETLTRDASGNANETWNAFLQDSKNREMLLPDHFTASEKERILKKRFNEWLSEAAKGDARDLAREDADKIIQKRSSGTEIMKAPAGLLNPVINRLKKTPEPVFDFIPTRTQAEALAHLFHATRATQIELYGKIEEGECSLEGLLVELDRLVGKGFLEKQKISPQLVFSIHTPLGSIPLEMSKKNRLNPLYRYEIKIERNTLMHYLQSRLTALEDSRDAAADTSYVKKRIADLQYLMGLLVKESE